MLATSYDDEEDAIRSANDLISGLHGTVFWGDNDQAERVARRPRMGGVAVSGSHSTCIRQSAAEALRLRRELGSGAQGVPDLTAIQLEA